MTPAQLSLKGAARRLTSGLGGLDGAAACCNRKRSVIADYGNINAASHMPIDVVADLEAALGQPVVTRALAFIAGFELVPLALDAAAVDPVRAAARFSADVGKFAAAALQAEADGQLSTQEIDGLITDAHTIVQRALQTLGNLRALRIKAGG